MALQFVLGSAGSGKSGYVFRKTVKEAQKNLKKNYYVYRNSSRCRRSVNLFGYRKKTVL